MEINLLYVIIFVVIVFLCFNWKNKENMEQKQNPCSGQLTLEDIAEVKTIVGQLNQLFGSNNPENLQALTSEQYKNKINKLTSILTQVDTKCINYSVMNPNFKNQYCNKETKDGIMKTLNFIDEMIDKYGFNVFVLLDHYENILQDLEKTCYQEQNAEIMKKIKRIIKKLSLIISVDENIKKQLNY